MILLVGSPLSVSPPVSSAQTLRSQWDGVYTADQATRGEALYEYNCAACHNWDLSGNEIGPALTGPAFAARWDGRAIGELFAYSQALMPQNSPGGLRPEQTADILAFLFQRGAAPSGGKELPIQGEALSQTLYLAQNP